MKKEKTMILIASILLIIRGVLGSLLGIFAYIDSYTYSDHIFEIIVLIYSIVALGIGITAMLFHRQGEGAALSVVPPVFSGTLIFVTAMVLGVALIYFVLCVVAVKMKKPLMIVLFFISFLKFHIFLSCQHAYLSFGLWFFQILVWLS